MGLYDFPIAGIVEPQGKKKISGEPVGHFAGLVPFRDDLALTGLE